MSIVCGASCADTAVFAPDNQAVLAGIRSLVLSRLIPFTFFGAVQRQSGHAIQLGDTLS